MRRPAQLDPTPETSSRSAFGLMGDRIFGPYIAGKLLSTTGVWIHNIAAAILAFQLTHSAFVVGLVSIAQFMPQLLLAGVSGSMADRGDRRLQIVVGRLVVALGSGGLAAWLWLAGVDGLPGAWPVILAALVVGIGFVIGGPAMNALVPNLVRPAELAAAIGLNNVPITIARAVGPALGALVTAGVGPALAFTLAAAGNAAFAATMLALPIGRRPSRQGGGDRRMRAGIQHVRQDPTVIWLLVGVAAVAIGADPAITLTPPLSDELGRGTQLVGLLASAFGVGAVVALPLMAPVRRRFGEAWLTTASLCLLAVGLLSLTIARVPALAVTGFVIAGMGMMSALTSLSTQIQVRLPDAVRGRVMALWAVAFLGSRPAASALDGAVAEWVSVDAALVLIAATVLAAAWTSRPQQIAPVPDLRSPGTLTPAGVDHASVEEPPARPTVEEA